MDFLLTGSVKVPDGQSPTAMAKSGMCAPKGQNHNLTSKLWTQKEKKTWPKWSNHELPGGGHNEKPTDAWPSGMHGWVANHGAKVPPISGNMGPHTANHIVESTLNSIPNTLKQ